MTWEELGRLQFREEEAEIIMNEKLNDKTRKEVLRGRLMAEAEVRASILLMAKQGSSPAQKQMLELMDKLKEGKGGFEIKPF